MKQIPLTQGKLALVDDEDFGRLNAFKWQAHRSRGTWYAVRMIYAGPSRGPRMEIMHRTILAVTDPAVKVDHWDGNGLNNQRFNLRPCTSSQNRANGPKYAGAFTSSFRGVYWEQDKRQWRASLRVDGRRIHLGRFDDEQDAAKAYDAAALEHFKEFARPNFPRPGA